MPFAVEKLALFLENVEDLNFLGTDRVGTCPSCRGETALRIIRTPTGYEASCRNRCTEDEIKDAIRAILAAKAGKGTQPVNGRAPPRNGQIKTGTPAASPPKSAREPDAAPLAAAGATIQPEGFTAQELLRMEIEPARYAIDGYICEGLNIFAGGQKKGKSWMAYGWAIAVAAGGYAFGQIPVEQGAVLYLALEDGPRRLKQRLVSMLQGEPAPADLHLYHRWPGTDGGGIPLLETWLKDNPNARMVVIDTLGRFRGSRAKNGDVFQQDYDFGARLKRLADEHRIALVVLHHLSKRQCEDPFDQVSGTIAVTASADATLLLQRQRGKDEGTLFVTGRDVEEREMAVSWAKDAWAWTLAGTAEEFKMSGERKAIVDLLRRRGALKPAAVSEDLGKNRSTTRNLLVKMAEKGELKTDGGLYWAPSAEEEIGIV